MLNDRVTAESSTAIPEKQTSKHRITTLSGSFTSRCVLKGVKYRVPKSSLCTHVPNGIIHTAKVKKQPTSINKSVATQNIITHPFNGLLGRCEKETLAYATTWGKSKRSHYVKLAIRKGKILCAPFVWSVKSQKSQEEKCAANCRELEGLRNEGYGFSLTWKRKHFGDAWSF